MGVYSGNRTLLGESMETDCATHALDFVIECERNELKLFNAVIGCDMIQAYTEAGLTTLTEDDNSSAQTQSKKSLVQRIKDMFNKAVETIKRFIATFIAKVSNLIHNDAKLVKQYGDNFQKNAVNYQLKFDWKPIIWKNVDTNYEDRFKKIYKSYTDNTSAIGRADDDTIKDSNKVSELIKSFKDEMKESDPYKEIEIDFWEEKSKENYSLTSDDVKYIYGAVVTGKSTINAAKRYGNYVIKEIKGLQNDVKMLKSGAKDDTELARLNASYKIGSIFVKQAQKQVNAYIGGLTRVLAQCRKAFVAAGKNAGSTNESALYDNLLAESSDIYVMQALDMAM